MGLIAQSIRSIAEAIPETEYFQVSDTQKAEFELSRKDLRGKTAIVYNDLPDIPITQNPGTITENYPIEILFIGLQLPDEVSAEEILDITKAVWATFYNQFKLLEFINLELSADLAINAGAAYRLGTETFTGWQFLMTLSLEGCPTDPTF